MERQIDDISRIFSVLPNALTNLPNVQTKLPIARLRPGQHLPNFHQMNGLVPVTIRPCVNRWAKPYSNIKPANQFPSQHPIVFNSLNIKGQQIFLPTPAFGYMPRGPALAPFKPNGGHLYPEEPKAPVFSKPWHKPYKPEPDHCDTESDVQKDKSTELTLAWKDESTSGTQETPETQTQALTDNTRKMGKYCVKNLKPNYPKCSKNNFVKSMDLISLEEIHKPSVWLNVTLQVDTSSEIKRGQPVAQYRSIISSVLTELYFPPKLSPPDHLHSDKMAATASYDERGRLTVLEVEFITAGIYKVANTSGENVLGKSSRKPVTLTRLESLETLSPKSQYFIMGDLCPVPKTFPKCHRNAHTLHKKLIEFMYTREFRKYTLPLLAQVGEEDVWTTALKAPRTRSRASEYDDDQFNKLFVKRKPPSSPDSSNEDKEDSTQRPKRARYCREKSPVKRFPDNEKTEEAPTTPTETPLPRRSRRIRGSRAEQTTPGRKTCATPAVEKQTVPTSEGLLEEISSTNAQQTEQPPSSEHISSLPTSSHSSSVPSSSSSSSGESDSNCSFTGSEQSSISQIHSPFERSSPHLDHSTSQFIASALCLEPSSPNLDPPTSYDLHIFRENEQLHVPHDVTLCSASGRISPLTTLSEQTTELLSNLMSKASSSMDFSPNDLAPDKLVPSISCDSYPLTSQLCDILSIQSYSPDILEPSNSVTDSVETCIPLETLDMPELTFWDDLSLPLDLSLQTVSSDLPLDLSCKSNRR